MGYKKYYDLEKYFNWFVSNNMRDRAEKLLNFADGFCIDKMTSIEPKTGKERKITVGKISENCIIDRYHRECEKRAHELLLQHHIIARSNALKKSFNALFCENNPEKIIDIIYSWNEFVYYLQTNDLIIDIYNNPKFMWWFPIDAKTLAMIQRKSPDEAYLDNEIIRFYDSTDGAITRYTVSLTPIAERKPGKFKLGKTNIINLPFNGNNGMYLTRPALI